MPAVSVKKSEGYGSFFLLQDSMLNMSQEYVCKIYENPGSEAQTLSMSTRQAMGTSRSHEFSLTHPLFRKILYIQNLSKEYKKDFPVFVSKVNVYYTIQGKIFSTLRKETLTLSSQGNYKTNILKKLRKFTKNMQETIQDTWQLFPNSIKKFLKIMKKFLVFYLPQRRKLIHIL